MREAARRIIPARAGFTGRGGRAGSAGEDHPRSRGVYPTTPRAASSDGGSSPLARGLRGRRGRSPGGPPDHPRSRGVYRPRDPYPASASGSSPLARGLQTRHERHQDRLGIIPARAGFTTSTPWSTGAATDHPRSRGVYGPWSVRRLKGSGSSPLARGLLDRGGRGLLDPGIIPARAGFTAAIGSRPRATPDHPRSRGVYSCAPSWPPPPRGSSPLARGLQTAGGDHDSHRRIIPARAGFTPPPPGGRRAPSDHPRSRGVYVSLWAPAGMAGGSSPLARGLPVDHAGRPTYTRIIPARAGFTRPSPRSCRRPSDHPRSRGVYRPKASAAARAQGSSPLARGLRILRDAARTATMDHPRSRGVYHAPHHRDRLPPGSSPLARGLRALPPQDGLEGGIIPARAGFTRRQAPNPRPGGGSSPLARGLPNPAPRPHGRGGIIPARAGFTRLRRRRDVRAPWIIPARAGFTLKFEKNVLLDTGSSPLARGLHARPGPAADRRRIIPARAGFTSRPDRSPSAPADHPRSRGVYRVPSTQWVEGTGSSPLARGLPGPRPPGRQGLGIIPARAGFTRDTGTRTGRARDHPRSRGVYH